MSKGNQKLMSSPKSSSAKKPVQWSLNWAATEWKVSIATIQKGLATNGVLPKDTYTTVEIDAALNGDLKAARARQALANAVSKERENKIADGEVATLTEVLAWMQSVLLPIRQRLLALAGQMAHRCNPVDPAHAQTQLDEWVKETLPLLREEIGKAGK